LQGDESGLAAERARVEEGVYVIKVCHYIFLFIYSNGSIILTLERKIK
jgi:hypothetical protein